MQAVSLTTIVMRYHRTKKNQRIWNKGNPARVVRLDKTIYFILNL